MPKWEQEIRRRLSESRLAPTRENGVIEELSQYLDDCYDELRASGVSESEAYRRTLAELSGSEMLQRELRRAERQAPQDPIVLGTKRRTMMIADLWQDLRYGARMLLKNPGFTLIAVATLSLGIGANTAIFSVLHGVLLKPLLYPDPNPIVRVWQAVPTSGYFQLGFSEAQLTRLRAGNQSFQQIGGYAIRSANLTEQNETQRVAVTYVAAGVFESLGVQPSLGRTFRREDEAPGSQRVAVLGYEMWQRRYGGDANILGRTIRVNDNPVTVIGVMPPDFRLPEDLSVPQGAQLLLSARIDPANLNWGSYYLRPIARLKPGVRPEQAFAEVSSVFAQLRQDHPQGAITDPRYYIRVLPLHDDLIGAVKKALWVLVGAVGLVLLIACANVSGLLLARRRASERDRCTSGARRRTRAVDPAVADGKRADCALRRGGRSDIGGVGRSVDCENRPGQRSAPQPDLIEYHGAALHAGHFPGGGDAVRPGAGGAGFAARLKPCAARGRTWIDRQRRRRPHSARAGCVGSGAGRNARHFGGIVAAQLRPAAANRSGLQRKKPVDGQHRLAGVALSGQPARDRLLR